MLRKISITLIIIGTVIFVVNSWELLVSSQSVDQISSNNEAINTTENLNNTSDKENNYYSNSNLLTTNYEFEEEKEIAQLEIPTLGKSYDIYWGTNENSLKKGVGMFVSDSTTIPNNYTGHTVLSGHRNTVFNNLDKLKDGDELIINFNGDRYKYKINRTWITEPEDRTVIVGKENPILTLTTCYPFDYIGFAPYRYIIEAKLVEI